MSTLSQIQMSLREQGRGDASPPGRLLSARDVADILGVPLSWVYDHVRGGCRYPLPVVRVGKYLRFRAGDLAMYIDSLAGRRSRH